MAGKANRLVVVLGSELQGGAVADRKEGGLLVQVSSNLAEGGGHTVTPIATTTGLSRSRGPGSPIGDIGRGLGDFRVFGLQVTTALLDDESIRKNKAVSRPMCVLDEFCCGLVFQDAASSLEAP